ncbi:MAG: alcohol dehydrogenase catalytic domain-containing protein [Candidatus Thermoplasmatota archaeon]|nr:zinc-binding dehydrogenase [Euryarchaeota archaeon]MBU4031812.1 alcohol dehydrogenase catalytic domain-containing protein [Candidatus Thermoplasmatota archaeon]MBU4072046.1 alcohol dehydrogenase catalytic domain-containing protein [Candidatus Thermoplasmatota archaeon]MBU4144577.1 alcohol dehydrogenase catalytic domain-containing protein [Candidatus Thermoplasmatota archaeon]MBU4592126.1 alcohol dehydrogenase catalytic domain-containing protein [Candidatus Thermoplasmatota archaeon]
MRVAMYYSNKDVRLEKLPVPDIGTGEILMRVEASGICGSDVMEWYRRDKVPLVLGHEVAGTVEKVGKGVEKFKPGDRIVAAHHVPCNTCDYCHHGHHTACKSLQGGTNFHPGGFAEFVRLPAINVDRGTFLIPEKVSFEDATFAEPLACVLRGQKKMSIKHGASVFVIGAGISGLLHVSLARAMGAGRIVAADISEYRLDMAMRFGADDAIMSDENLVTNLIKANGGKKAQNIIVCTGAMPAIKAALEAVDKGGTVLFFAPTAEGKTFPFSINDVFWKKEVTLMTTYAAAPADHVAALELIRVGSIPVDEMITHRFGLADAQKGFGLVAGGGDSVKVIILPQV